MHDNKNKYTFRKHKAYGLVGAMFATALMATPGALGQVPLLGNLFGTDEVHAQSYGTPPSFNVPNATLITTNNVPDERMDPIYTADSSLGAGSRVPYEYGTIGGRIEYTYRDNSTGRTSSITYSYPSTPDKIRVGTQDSITNVYEEIETQYVADKERPKGGSDIVKSQGVRGRTEKRTSYTLDTYSGNVSPSGTTTRVIDKMEPKIIARAAKDKVETTTTPSVKKYVKDPTRVKGAENLITQGRDGSITTTTTYDVNAQTGEITEHRGQPVTVEMTPTIVKVAAKDKVETFQRGRQTVERTTVYTVNENTGDITESVSERVVKEITYKEITDEPGESGTHLDLGNNVIGVITTPKVEETRIPFETRYEPNPQADRDVRSDKVVGKDGKTIKTTTYTLNKETGTVTPNAPTTTTEPAVTRVVSVGTKPKTVTEVIASPKEFVKDPTREKGAENVEVAGTPGRKETTTTYDLNTTTGVITDRVGQPVTTPPTKTIVKVAAKDKVVSTVLPSPRKYRGSESKDYGSENTEAAGTAGVRKVTTVYTVDPTTGNISEKSTTTETAPTDTIVTVGTKPTVTSRKDDQGRTEITTTTYVVAEDTGKVTPTSKVTYGATKEPTVSTEELPSPKKYEKDPTREKGSENITVPGKAGKKVTTTTYTVDPASGKVTPTVGKPVITEPTATIIKVAAKDKVVVSQIEPTTRYEKDPMREKGAENITEAGKKGSSTVTTVYTVNPDTGAITETVGQPVVDPAGVTVVKVAAKDKVVVTTIPSPKKYESDDSRAKGTPNVEVPGKAGKDVATTVYTVNPDTGAITETTNTVRESEPTATIVKVASKPEVDYGKTGGSVVENKTEFTVDPNTGELKPTTTSRTLITDKEEESPIPSPEKYVADKSREKGTENVREEGVPGIEVTRTSYSMNPSTGKIDEAVTKFVKKQPTETIIKVGAKDKVVVTAIPKETRYEKDANRDKGAEDITVEGTDGTSTVTTTYTVNPTTGGITENTGKPVVVNPTATIVKVAAKDKVVETVIPSPRKYVGDVLKTKGTENEIFLGHNGKDVTTTVYTVNPLTGEVTESTTTKHAGVATETIIRVGAKPIVELEKKDGIVYRNTTTFAVDLNTGEITETKLREALFSFGNEAAPTVEVPEFNGGVNGDADGNAAINEVPEFTGAVGTAGEELPPVLDVPEFTGGVNGDMDGQPAINEVPEFDLSTLKPEPEYGIGDTFNDGRYPKPVAEDNKPSIDEAPAVSDVEIVPADKKVVDPTVSNEFPPASPLANKVVEAPNAVGTSTSAAPSGKGATTVNELPNTGGSDNAVLGMAGLALGALGIASLKKKED